ncbi:uncharacterized protein VDAG_08788 [Verticillium dahliae VdLs.17]|uniref:Uncharacterized protein n=1 Tax=Verticillium dahliae (strain VdLs.17 / ATCC MYA-4575 / FGSC 10137) TaxID=498257 RepID=G2XF56_VERDV|nr:uncharacterized protein VDAG_08788 [Verticillium dahliae VdLs.17]EGY18454.1 hypothetical protein VDAG_08788 [Verticillium dahliae VdLs.17]
MDELSSKWAAICSRASGVGGVKVVEPGGRLVGDGDGAGARRVVLVGVALELHEARVGGELGLGAGHVAVLAGLGDVEPAADGHADAAALARELGGRGGVVDLLDVVEGLARLDGEEGQLVPGGRDDLCAVGSGRLGDLAAGALLLVDGVEAQGAAPLGLPGHVGVGEIEDVADLAGADDVVVAEQVAAGRVDVDGHVGLAAAQGARSR